MISLAGRHGLIVFAASVLLACGATGATFKLHSGETITGDAANFNDKGVIFKLPDGNYGARVAWTNLTQEALKEINKIDRAKAFVEQFLEPDEAELAELK